MRWYLSRRENVEKLTVDSQSIRGKLRFVMIAQDSFLQGTRYLLRQFCPESFEDFSLILQMMMMMMMILQMVIMMMILQMMTRMMMTDKD